MRKKLMAGLLLAVLCVQADQVVTPQYVSSNYLPSEEYLSQAISLQIDTQLKEGILAYADNIAQGDKVTVVSSALGIAIYAVNNGQYQLVHEVSNTELGLEAGFYINELQVSPTDKWVLIRAYGIAISLPLNKEYQPVITAISTTNIDYGSRVLLRNGLAVVNTGYEINTYSVAADNGRLTPLATLQLPRYAEHIALSGNTLLVANSSWQNEYENLAVYQLQNGQWQYVSGHSMSHNLNGHQYVGYLTVNPSGKSIVYGGNNFSYILNYDSLGLQLSEISSGNNLFNSSFSELNFVDDNNILLRNSNTLRLYNANNLQQVASVNLNNITTGVRAIAGREQTVTVLNDTGLLQLNTNTLAVAANIKPGEQDVVLGFSTPDSLLVLNDDYLLNQNNRVFRLYKLNEQGMPELMQSSTQLELLGHDSYYYSTSAHNLGDGLFAIFQSNYYSLLKLDPQNHKLQLLNSGVLADRNGYPFYINSHNLVNVGPYLVIARNDTLNLLRLEPNNQFRAVNTVANGVSGVSGIADIQMLMVVGDNIYTVDQQQQIISHFVIANNILQQKQLFTGFSLPALDSYYARNNLLTIKSNNYLQNYSVGNTGELVLLSNQYLQTDFQRWVPVGDRFVALSNWNGFQILEQDNTSGLWNNSLSMSSWQLLQDYQIGYSALVPLAGKMGIYDVEQRRLIRFTHNSAPFVKAPEKLQLSLNQGKNYQIALSSVISDEEDTALTFSLQNAAAAFSLSTDGSLSFNGQANESGNFDVLTADAAGLVSRVNFQYQLNLAPVVKASLPVFPAVEGADIQIELAQYFTDPEGLALQFAFASPQTGLTLSSTGLLTGKFNSAAEFNLSFTVTDSAGAVASHTAKIVVAAKPQESSGGSLHWLLVSLLACTAWCRVNRRR